MNRKLRAAGEESRPELTSFAVLTAGAFAHYSYALHDAIDACTSPVVEVHISNVLVLSLSRFGSSSFAELNPSPLVSYGSYAREEFRHKSVTARVSSGYIAGAGIIG